MKRSHTIFFGALWFAMGLGCAGRVVDDSGSPEEPSCQAILGARLIRHACSHTENGPYADIAAQSSNREPADVSQLHKPFDVTAVDVPFSLNYEASREGTHVLFTDKPTAWEVFSADGAPLEVRTNATAPSDSEDSCAGTGHAALVELTRGETYRLSSTSASKRFILFIEHAQTFGNDAFVSICPDEEL